jgi:hypothetical protein
VGRRRFDIYHNAYGVLLESSAFLNTATTETSSSRNLEEKLLLEGNCENEFVKDLKIFSLQLQAL